MNAVMDELELTVSRRIAAPRKMVFDAWLSAEMLAKFMRPGGTTAARVTNDPVKGGRFSIVMTDGGKDIPHAGTYVEIDRHARLAFTWQSPHSLDDSVVTIDFREVDAGTTEVTLHQVKFRSEQARDGHTKGWTDILACLDKMLG